MFKNIAPMNNDYIEKIMLNNNDIININTENILTNFNNSSSNIL